MKPNKLIIFDSESLPLNLVKENDVYIECKENNVEEHRIIKNIKINRVKYLDSFKKYEAEVIVHYVVENSSKIQKEKFMYIVNDLNEISIEICGVFREEKISYFDTNFAN